jgi:hypothetical protein
MPASGRLIHRVVDLRGFDLGIKLGDLWPAQLEGGDAGRVELAACTALNLGGSNRGRRTRRPRQ